jgi:hypothetical protein
VIIVAGSDTLWREIGKDMAGNNLRNKDSGKRYGGKWYVAPPRAPPPSQKKKFEVTMAAASQPRSEYKRQPNHLIETTSKLQLQTACSETLNPIDE